MKKKKIIVICAFLLLVFITAIFTIVSAVKSYQYDMDPANGVDLLEGLEAILIVMIGGSVVFYELDLFYTTYYFLIKPKTIAKSILNILANLSLLLVFFNEYYKDIFSEDIIALAPCIIGIFYHNCAIIVKCSILKKRKTPHMKEFSRILSCAEKTISFLTSRNPNYKSKDLKYSIIARQSAFISLESNCSFVFLVIVL